MARRIAIGGLHHESDTFNPIITGEKDILVSRGEEILSFKSRNAISGIISALSDDYVLVPTLFARAVPNGEWDRKYYEKLRDELISKIKDSLPLDGICLALHGSMRVKDIGPSEEDVLSRIREICPDVPIFVSLDMHATLTEKMLRCANGFVGYKTAPHIDEFETGEHAARLLKEYLEKGISPVMSAIRIPLLASGEMSETNVYPMNDIMRKVRELEKRDKVLALSLLMGFPWADTEHTSAYVLAVSDGDEKIAEDIARELSSYVWERKSAFTFYNETYEPDVALDEAYKSIADGVFPVVISDSGDNPTAGSSQDVTNFLKLILSDSRLSSLEPPLVYQAIYDPEVVVAAIKAGVGSDVEVALGAKFDTRTSTPLNCRAKVLAIKEDWKGSYRSDLVLLDIKGVDVVVTSAHVGCYEPDMMRALGVIPEDRKCIVVKLGYLEPEIRSIARRSMMALTDGSSNEVFTRLDYKRIPRPIYPLDGEFLYEFPLLDF